MKYGEKTVLCRRLASVCKYLGPLLNGVGVGGMEKLGETFTGLVGWRNWEKLSLSKRLAAPNVSARAQLVEKKKGGNSAAK